MKTIFIIVWLLLGFILVWRAYFGLLKEWYEDFNESYWDFDRKMNGVSAIRMFVWLSPIFILGGPMCFILNTITLGCWYFKVPKNNIK